MLNIGSHLSTSKGYKKMGEIALEMGANTFQFFTRNPRGGKAKALDMNDIHELEKIIITNNFAPLLAHAPYTLNLCSIKEDTRNFGKMIFKDDLIRLENMPCSLYNFHPGSHTGQGAEKGIELIADALNEVISEDITTTILLEAMSGKGTEVGKTFEELQAIIEKVKMNEKLGVCIDTCHIFAAGYDIVNDLDGVLNEFNKIIGIERLKAIHLNDSLMPYRSNKDRHAGIGEGEIGLEALVRIVTHPKLKNLPFFLETPYEVEGHIKEIKLLNNFISGNNN